MAQKFWTSNETSRRLWGGALSFLLRCKGEPDAVGTQLEVRVGCFDSDRFITFQPGSEDGCPGTAERVQ